MNEFRQQPDPDALRDDLREAIAPRRPLSSAVRQRVLARAAARSPQPRSAPRGRPWARRRWLVAGAAAAAAVVLLVISPTLRQSNPLPGDVDGDGLVNVRDAYLLARSLEAKRELDAGADLDGDGRVDRGDVDRLMEKIVQIEEGRS